MQTTVKVSLYNIYDEFLARSGIKKPGEVRQLTVECIADSGATRLTLPEDIAEKLELVPLRKVNVRYADGRIEERWVKGGARVEIEGRTCISDILVEKAGTRPLLGHVEMELLDLIVDPSEGKVKPTPRPESPELPLIEQL